MAEDAASVELRPLYIETQLTPPSEDTNAPTPPSGLSLNLCFAAGIAAVLLCLGSCLWCIVYVGFSVTPYDVDVALVNAFRATYLPCNTSLQYARALYAVRDALPWPESCAAIPRAACRAWVYECLMNGPRHAASFVAQQLLATERARYVDVETAREAAIVAGVTMTPCQLAMVCVYE